jgi:hypothetical protein
MHRAQRFSSPGAATLAMATSRHCFAMNDMGMQYSLFGLPNQFFLPSCPVSS